MRINTVRLRCMLGWLGMLLPWIVVVLQFCNDVFKWPESISATWYTNACTPFMIILGASSILLMCYKGYDLQDDIILTLSGVSGLGICLFPTWRGQATDHVGTFLLENQLSNKLHIGCALVFFALLSYNSIFLFTKGDGTPTKNKRIRNIIYIVCGVGMLASFSLMLLPYFPCRIWAVEALALTFFGISFLTKADVYPWLFCDKKENK